MTHIRKSIPTEGAAAWWAVGWSYIMPDFSKPGHSIVEWLSENPPVYPIRVDGNSEPRRNDAASTQSFGERNG